ncbi:uncharacterized protein K444DRAFT_397865 [Hyaloscypha bicolor E]|uniref:Uncharacterized protein n=1 Tax=Hyaloscypha bicolor E TaxID=1095630 RepID=A0A2J6TAR9_9HELO|nr:uncharacterized protein K444DRAFT_397865 [Hyaloscypha bicolor E]PMD60134.1 hypothetical protein K444DRAFT_397865 [Hyaloscypha bicolor E]
MPAHSHSISLAIMYYDSFPRACFPGSLRLPPSLIHTVLHSKTNGSYAALLFQDHPLMGPPGRTATMRSRGEIEMHNAADSTIATISRSHNNYFLNRRTYILGLCALLRKQDRREYQRISLRDGTWQWARWRFITLLHHHQAHHQATTDPPLEF